MIKILSPAKRQERTPSGRPVLFLDIDGVLRVPPYRRLIGNDPDFKPAAVTALNSILRSVEPLLVISSDWRQRLSVAELDNLLKSGGCSADHARIAGVTPQLSEGFRLDEIECWLVCTEHRGAYVMIDDDPSICAAPSHAVLTDEAVGLTEKQATQAKYMLTAG